MSEPNSAALTQLRYALWSPAPSIADRYPGQTGLLLTQQIWSDYVTDTNSTQQFFDDNLVRLLVRHPLNRRNVAAVTDEVSVSIRDEGLVPTVSGQ